ncbi:gag-pol protein [Lasius niger]|uniref:Gag-pol protein n=1 Tax=Lasius niger TaxID=67767 RepID=A0A0J7K7L1_LASNI|nr:gag-pol protein [Lasius niger]
MGIDAHNIGASRGVVTLRLQSRHDPSIEFSVSAFILPKVTGRIPSRQVTASWNHLRGLQLADPEFATPGPIDIILGADVYGSLLLGDIRRESLNSPVAQHTTLGWIVSGPLNAQSSSSDSASIISCCKLQDVDLHDTLQKFWIQEDVIPSITSRLTPDEQACETHFRTTHSRDKTGRYIVRLPFRSSTTGLGDSLPSASRSFARVRQRIRRDEVFGKLYSDFLQEYADLGHMVPTSSASQHHLTPVYLPHHGVLRESSSTTKLRVVFNGSAPTSSGISLNDCLHAGPKLQQDLDAVILRWRMHAFAFAADIEKMYRQIVIHPEDRHYQQILWATSDSPRSYQLTTVTYGLTCAPYLALRVLQQLAKDEEHVFPQASNIVRTAIYVDDVLSGADTPEDAKVKALQLTELLRAGGFKLQKWSANNDDLLQGIADSSQCSSARELQSEARTLGLTWHPASDSFKFHVSRSDPIVKLTKRSILSKIAQLFDPLGWLAPVTILGKMFIQQLWKLNIEWDDPLPPSLAQQWNQFDEDLRGVSEYSIPRWLGTSTSTQGVEFHGFSDASQDALGAVLYIRTIQTFTDAKVTLLAAKSKVAPLKKQTIPRLELAAAVLLSRLLARVRTILGLQHVPAHLWVDSSVSLAWIRGHPSQWQEFVANRVAVIQELVPDARWHHVAGSENPADCVSRGLSPSLLQTHSLWWRGPVWLQGPSVGWPSTAPPIDDAINLEKKRPHQVLVTAVSKPSSCSWNLIDRFSSLDRLLRITAWILRSVAIFKGADHYSSRALHPEELIQARTFWIKDTQRAYFNRELEICSTKTSLPRTHPLLKLAPFVDSEGVLRVGGRLKNSLLDPDGKHPAILPRDSSFSRLVISDLHHRTLHGGTQVVLATLRQHYWILGGRAPVSSFIRRCVRCARHRAATAQEMMGSLPTSRVTPTRPFLHSGVDYAGPYTLRTWRGRASRTYKAYLIVFICFSTSAVHLDLATDYSTQGFLAAYRRFIARRGRCVTISSDCGTNFVGADAELRRLFNSASKDAAEIAHLLAADGTEWKFNPPSAPHFGGKWEAAVKSTKFHLRRLIGDTILTYEEFNTLLTQVEAVLNSRPLSTLSDDPADVNALTPAHFLIGEPLIVLPEPPLNDVPISRLSRWQLLRQMLERFWARWSTEYLQRLQTRNKWHLSTKPLQIGDLVLVLDERYPPAKWPLARVTALHPGTDGRVRVVTVRTAVSEYKRPIVKLCPLPIAT